ncbi:hypothetical protein JRO89_XS04G0210600 [Xanthoceras sorbifolium]|uniref:Uncharacterized protein n=1 Tax=Xanthoceras sorbifolium TaxID=99658 RepID=A0ABQ8I727_9ROSI|nr:hypothetical protein JRO89_XS04G0210600 [Xanthoceras sorbifolium]
MTMLPDIIDLFSRLASHLQPLNCTSPIHCQEEEEEEDDEAINLSISKLNHSLNLCDNSGVRVLDTALSLMCFEAPTVFDSVIDFSVKTIVSVLSSLITCKLLRIQNEQVLLVGSSISRHGCLELIEACNNVLEKLEERGMPSHLLSRACVRVAVSASRYRFSYPLMHFLDFKPSDGRSTAVTKLLCHLPREISIENHEIPLRVLFWFLDPLTLKHDVSKILQDTVERPFLCLGKEFHERMDWRAVAICLVLSPVMFIETRVLLHNWFLLTGLASILELLIGLVSVILDIISSPSWWGIPLELGSNLPFSSAYFPSKNRLLRILAGPLSSEVFLSLVHATKQFDPTANTSATKTMTIDHKSIWALAINFPDWFYFASVLLFSKKSFQENFHSKYTLGEPKTQMQDLEPLSVAAAKYISWILSPMSKSKQQLLVDLLTQISEAWTVKQLGSSEKHKEAEYRKKPKKPKFQDSEDYTCETIGLWLKDFQSLYMHFCIKSLNDPASCEANASHGLSMQKNVMFRRIPLGILVGFPDCINKEECELLLHYAATGKINQLGETRSAGSKHGKLKFQGQEESVTWPVEFSKTEAIAGAHLVFSLTDIVESMSASLCETEERGLDFICQMKVKAGKYLIKCIERLIQLNVYEDGIQVLMDLSNRLMHWKHQGQEIAKVDKDLDNAINGLNKKLSSIEIL